MFHAHTFPLLGFLVHISDLVVRPQNLEVVSFVDEVQCSDELLGKLFPLSAFTPES